MTEKITDLLTWGGCILGLTLQDIQALAAIICITISIISSLINIIIKFKNALKDGKLTVDELEDIKSELDDLKHNIEGKDKHE